jgi:hypothetical protein
MSMKLPKTQTNLANVFFCSRRTYSELKPHGIALADEAITNEVNRSQYPCRLEFGRNV